MTEVPYLGPWRALPVSGFLQVSRPGGPDGGGGHAGSRAGAAGLTTAVEAGSSRHQAAELPEGFWYAVKRRVLGPPLVTEQLKNERLSRPLALGVLSCDGLSSAAYGTEEILRALLPFFGLAAFSLVLPMTLVVLAGVVLVVLSYREVVSVYTRAGGSYVWPGRTSARGWPRWPRSRC